MTRMPFSEISTPCIKICVIDPLSALCIGCGRSAEEIAEWCGMSEPERLAVMSVLDRRLRALRSRKHRGGRVGRRAPA